MPMPKRPALTVNIFRDHAVSPLRFKSTCRRITVPLLLPRGRIGNLDNEPANDVEKTGENASIAFPFMSLPIEIRLQIYALLLPSRRHLIRTQHPLNGSYYSEAPLHSASSFYSPWPSRFQQQQIPSHTTRLTTYKVMNENVLDSPLPSMYVQILRVSCQVHAEAESVLYGRQTTFDFDSYADAIIPFFSDRSLNSRSFIRRISLTVELLREPSDVKGGAETSNVLWHDVCDFLIREFPNLRILDLTMGNINEGIDHRDIGGDLMHHGSAFCILPLIRSGRGQDIKVSWWEKSTLKQGVQLI